MGSSKIFSCTSLEQDQPAFNASFFFHLLLLNCLFSKFMLFIYLHILICKSKITAFIIVIYYNKKLLMSFIKYFSKYQSRFFTPISVLEAASSIVYLTNPFLKETVTISKSRDENLIHFNADKTTILHYIRQEKRGVRQHH